MSNIFNDGGPLSSKTLNFYTKKTIQKTYNFMVYFDMSDSIKNMLGSHDMISEIHATDVEVPSYDFKKEILNIGPFIKSFPVLDHNGFEFTIKVDEDDQGRIRNFVNLLTRRIIRPDGYYNSYRNTVIDQIVVSIFRHDAANVNRIYFKNCYFMKASTSNFSYSTNEKLTYDLTFNSDHNRIYFGDSANIDDYTPDNNEL